MGDQQNYNFGGNFHSNQFNGEAKLTSLNINELAREDGLARRVRKSHRNKRLTRSALAAAVALIAIGVGYVFFLNRGDLTFSDLFNNFASAISFQLIGILVSGGLAVALGGAAVQGFTKESTAEEDALNQIHAVSRVVDAKGYDGKSWRAAKKSSKE